MTDAALRTIVGAMVTIGMNYKVRPGKEEVFERAFDAILASLAKADGHLKSWLYRDTHAPNSYMIFSEWDKRESFDAFIQSEAFKRVTNWGKEQILEDRPKHQVYSSDALH